MSNTDTSAAGEPVTGTCIIHVEGHLEDRRLPWLDGLTVTTQPGITVFHGPVADQAALHGLLQQLRNLDLPLISVLRVKPEGSHGSSPSTSSHIRT
jgi:hypothetical protein